MEVASRSPGADAETAILRSQISRPDRHENQQRIDRQSVDFGNKR